MSKLTHDFGTTFAVFGAGGVGGYFGAALARAGYSVAFIARLEWLVPDALQTGCDTLVSIGNIQSNHTRQVATVAAVLGLKCRLVQETWTKWDDPVYDKVGNILLSRLMGAETLFEGEGYSTRIFDGDKRDLGKRLGASATRLATAELIGLKREIRDQDILIESRYSGQHMESRTKPRLRLSGSWLVLKA